MEAEWWYKANSSEESEMEKMETMEIEGGNTKLPLKRQIQKKNWVFTLNNPTKKDLVQLETQIKGCERIIWQEEIGEEKTPHVQGAIVFKKRCRPIGVFNKLLGHKRTHFEAMRGSLQDQWYCNKEETRKPN